MLFRSEAYNCTCQRLVRELTEAGIELASERYNHDLRYQFPVRTEVMVVSFRGHLDSRFRQLAYEPLACAVIGFYLDRMITFASVGSLPAGIRLEDFPFLGEKQKLYYKLRTKKLAV